MDYTQARKNMVDCQLAPNKITCKSLKNRFLSVPREAFVDPRCKARAYADCATNISENRQTFAPMVTARLLQELDFQPEDIVLIAAAGTGYAAALISPLVSKVYIVEEDQRLLDIARKSLLTCKASNVEVICAKPEKGLSKQAPFNKILIDAPAGEIPADIIKQLAPAAKLAAVVTGKDELLEATIYTKNGKTLFKQPLFETCGTILKNFEKKERFVF